LVCLGDIAWDLLIKPQETLRWGSDVPGRAELLPGGSAANVAVWARRLGVEVRLVGKIGDDWLGELMRQRLAEEGLEDGLLVVPGARTARIGAIVETDGERAFVMDKERALSFGPEDYNASILQDADLFFFTGYTLFTHSSLHFVHLLLGDARRRNLPIAFDPASFHLIEGYGPERLLAEISPLDFLLLNEQEAEALLPGLAPDQLLRFAPCVAMKRGQDGSNYYAQGCSLSQPAYPAEGVDGTGAGDAFDAAFLVEMLSSSDPLRALQRGNRLGALVVAALGGQPSLNLEGGNRP
jgi:sugar/nucleoside kinase (ribokinase family)